MPSQTYASSASGCRSVIPTRAYQVAHPQVDRSSQPDVHYSGVRGAIGALITLREPTKPMLTEAAATGFYESKDFPGRYPRLQILTIAELLAGKELEYPAHRVETFAKAERKTKSEQEELF